MAEIETSIVIRAFNEERHLPSLLNAIQRQDYRDFEVIVVDSGSYDGTPEIAMRHGARLVRIESGDFTFGYSLNTGIRRSCGRFIAIVSAHTLPVDSCWLRQLIEHLRDPSVAMAYGRQLGTDTSKFSELRDFDRTFGDERRVVVPPNFFANNANSAIRKDLWEQHRFDEVLPGLEDVAWAKHWLERGFQVVYEPGAAIFHIHNETWRQVRRRYYREALSAKWIGITSRRHIPREMLREGKYLASDLLHAARRRCLSSKWDEIVQFRFHKAVGTVQGIWDGAAINDPRRRESVFFDKCYKAVVVRGPGRAALEELELPAVKPGDVLIKVAYVGACATDLQVLDGDLSCYNSEVPQYPIIPGREFSGVIAKVGSNVASLSEGTPVAVESVQPCRVCSACRAGNLPSCEARCELGVLGRNGAYGEYIVVPGEFVHVPPGKTDLKNAVLCESVAEVLRGLRRLRNVLSPESMRACAVVGSGPIGHLCALVLKSRGHEPTLYDCDPARLALIRDSGIRVSDDYRELKQFAALLETSGIHETQTCAIKASRSAASLLFLGDHSTGRQLDVELLAHGEKMIVFSAGSDAASFQEAIDMLPRLDLTAFLQAAVPLTQYKTAWKLLRERQCLRVLLEVDPDLQVRRKAPGTNRLRPPSSSYLSAIGR